MTERPAVLVTGGGRRLGSEIARAFGKAGWHVVIHYGRSRDAAHELAASLPSAEAVAADLADADAVMGLARDLAGRLPRWRVLVNCASVFELDLATALDPATFERSMRINAAAPTHLAQALLGLPPADEGRRVIAVTDQKVANPNPDFFSYTMSKHALQSTVAMLSMSRTDPRDRVYALAPGAILASHDQLETETERSHRMNLLRRKTGPEEIAEAALFLAEGWLESGTTLFVDSGQHLLAQPRDVLFLARQTTG